MILIPKSLKLLEKFSGYQVKPYRQSKMVDFHLTMKMVAFFWKKISKMAIFLMQLLLIVPIIISKIPLQTHCFPKISTKILEIPYWLEANSSKKSTLKNGKLFLNFAVKSGFNKDTFSIH